MSRFNELVNNDVKFLIEIHTIRNLPTSHINADNTGRPKETEFGGCTRARISSQSLKSAWRKSETLIEYTKDLSKEDVALRTRKLSYLVLEYMKENYGYTDDDENDISLCVQEIVGGDGKGVVCYITNQDIVFISYLIDKKIKDLLSKGTKIKELTEKTEKSKKGSGKKKAIFSDNEIKKEKKNFENKYGKVIPAIVNLFGRMSTSEAISNVESALSVGHAFSTHVLASEIDFFTASDDIEKDETDTGSGHLGETVFNSSCYYSYAGVSLNQFCKNLDENVTDEAYKKDAFLNVVKTMIEIVCLENPQTKKTSFACATFPECVYVTVKKRNIPCSLANAFAEPVQNDIGLVKNSVKRMADEIELVNDTYPISTAGTFWLAPRYKDVFPDDVKVVNTLPELIEKIGEIIYEDDND